MISNLPEALSLVSALKPAADAAGRTGNYVNLKYVQRLFALFYINQGNAATVACSFLQAKDVSGTGSKAFSAAVPIWTDLDADTASALTRQADAASYTTDAALKTKVVWFQIDPARLDVNNGFSTIAPVTGASNAANITSATFAVCWAMQQLAAPNALA
jgi:hypothetical protein